MVFLKRHGGNLRVFDKKKLDQMDRIYIKSIGEEKGGETIFNFRFSIP